MAADILSCNSIPTAYGETEYPVLLLGENARYIDLTALRYGAMLDIEAARILQQRGVDVGLLAVEPGEAGPDEHFIKENETVRGVGRGAKLRIRTAGAVESVFTNCGSAASYRYENAAGQRFFVQACRYYTPGYSFSDNYLRCWARRRQLTEVIPWLCGKQLPAVLADAPQTQLLVSKGEGAMSVAVLNLSYDEVIDPVIRLDEAYKQITCVNCTGMVVGANVQLSTIPPFGFAAFEVK